ncbi:MAG: class I SAM-dependent methyltransferase [Candidatus Moranbacteria bacterium]|nr:class I SAM-dependent methyltransferase [Candidatus Moranbacteria bacterium]
MFHVKQKLEELERCPFCQGKKFEPFLQSQDFLTYLGEFSVVECTKCRLIFTNPRPCVDSMGQFYPSFKYQSHKQNRSALFDRLYFFAQSVMLRRKLSVIEKHIKPGAKLLDIGCGVGQFAQFVASRGYCVSAIEPSFAARQEAQKKGLKVFENLSGFISAVQSRPQIITLWHVLEHQHNYFQNLLEYQKLLDSDGLLIIAVPLFESFDARFYKSSWAGYDLPRHLFHFNEKTIVKSASKAGFELVESKGLPFDSFYISLLSEKNRQSKLGFLRASLIGFVSNFMALLGIRPWSSQFFVFKKK